MIAAVILALTTPTVAAWTAPSAQKVFRDDAPPAVAKPVIRMYAARNEWENAQVVIRPDVAMKLTGAKVSGLNGLGAVNLFRVNYVYLPIPKKDYPDALPPLTTPLALEAGKCQPIWLNVHIPHGAKPGLHKGTLELTFEGKPNLKVPIELNVWDFAIPTKPTMATAFGIYEPSICALHGVKPGSDEAKKLMAQYWEALAQHRISTYAPPVDPMSPDAIKYLQDPRCTGFVIPYSEDDAKLRENVEFFKKNGVLNKGYFYVVDEVIGEPSYKQLIEVCRRIHAIDPKLRVISTFWGGPDFGGNKTPYELLRGIVNLWCPTTLYYDPKPMQARQAAGDEVWWYVCNGPGHPYANLQVDWAGTAHRLLFWQQKLHRVTGFLYWATTYWEPQYTKDPWTNITTCSWAGHPVYGDGSLFYPGNKVGVDGPVTSIRLELVRDGLEDYEYLQLYEKRFGREKTEALIGKLVKSRTEYSEDAAALEAVRQEMGEAIEKGRPARLRG